MIKNVTLEFEYNEKAGRAPLTVSEIENFIKSKGITPIRYALTEKNGNKIKLSVAGIFSPV